MFGPPKVLRLTPDAKKRSVSTPSHAAPSIVNEEVEVNGVLSLSPEMQAYMKHMEESVARNVEEQLQRAIAELTKKHEEVEKLYHAIIKDLRGHLLDSEAEKDSLVEKIKMLEAKAAGHKD